MKHHVSSLQPLKVIVVICILLLIFISWLLSVVLPITLIEMKYQYRKTLSQSLHVSSLRQLLFPRFSVDSSGDRKPNQAGIVIPAIFIDEPIIFNVDPNNSAVYLEALKYGIAHASGTAFPGSGGLGYYFAHSSLPAFVSKYNAVFYLLDKLHIGDDITIWRDEIRHDYIVFAKQLTTPDDVSFLSRTYNRDTIVLQTCWPPGASTKRLLVFASEKAK